MLFITEENKEVEVELDHVKLPIREQRSQSEQLSKFCRKTGVLGRMKLRAALKEMTLPISY